VWLSLDGLDGDRGIFSDNYFDVPAGRSVHVTLSKIENWDADRIASALRVRTLADSF
jgi:beta-mannosidase